MAFVILNSVCLSVCHTLEPRLINGSTVGVYVRSVQTVNGMHLFTTTGYKYFRSFEISLCAGGGGDAAEFPQAVCVNNASLDMQVCCHVTNYKCANVILSPVWQGC